MSYEFYGNVCLSIHVANSYAIIMVLLDALMYSLDVLVPTPEVAATVSAVSSPAHH